MNDAVTTVIQKRLATEKNPTIEAIINGLFRLETNDQAIDKITALKENFIISSKLPPSEIEGGIKLWIRGYKITEDEEKEGYLGNYAEISTLELADGKFTITAKKLDIKLKFHPQRKRPKKKHPDWGHPCMRLIKKGKTFETIEDAQKVLGQLHEEFPNISIPAVNKLFVIIYSKAEKPPVQKYILEIAADRDGNGFKIEAKPNKYDKAKTQAAKDVRKNPESSNQGSNAPDDNPLGKGYFASMIELKRNNKTQISELRKQSKENDQALNKEIKEELSEQKEEAEE